MLAATGLASKSADPAAAPSAAVTAPAAEYEARKSAAPQAGKWCRVARTSVIKSRVDQAVPKVGARMTVTPHILAPLHAAQAQGRPARGPGFWCCTGLVLLSTLAAASPTLAAPTSPPTAAQQKQRLQSHRQSKLPPLRQQGSTPAVAKGTLLPPQLSPPASPSAPTVAPAALTAAPTAPAASTAPVASTGSATPAPAPAAALPVPASSATSVVFFQLEGEAKGPLVAVPLHCYDAAAKKLTSGDACLKLVPEGAVVHTNVGPLTVGAKPQPQ